MVLQNKLVKLRPIKLSDAPHYVRWFADPEVSRNLLQQRITLKQERQWIKKLQQSKKAVVFAIETLEGRHIGSIGLDDIMKGDGRATYGIVIGDRQYWGRGYGRAASELILEYGFSKLKLNRIALTVYEFNQRGIRLYRKLGFKKEGVARQYVRREGRYYDAIAMSLLKPEWRLKRRSYS